MKNPMHDPAIEIEYSTGKIYYGGENGIYSSTDNGKTWTQYPFEVNGKQTRITSLEVNQNNGDLYAGYHYTGGFGKSTDGGKTWTIFTTTYCQSISIIDNDVFAGLTALFKLPNGDYSSRKNVIGGNDKVIEGPYGNLYSIKKSKGQIYKSTDGGDTWTLKHTTPNDVTFIAASKDGLLFGDWREGMFSSDTSLSNPVKLAEGASDAAHDGKGFMVFTRGTGSWSFSDDHGKTIWSPFKGEIEKMLGGIPAPNLDPDGVIDQLDVYNGKIYQSDTKGLIYVISKGKISGIENESMPLARVYPNPATSLVKFDVQNIQNITIYNSLGQIVPGELVGQSLDVSSYPEGMYFITLQSSEKSYKSSLIVKR